MILKKIIALYGTEKTQLAVKFKNKMEQHDYREKKESTLARSYHFLYMITGLAQQESESQTDALQLK